MNLVDNIKKKIIYLKEKTNFISDLERLESS